MLASTRPLFQVWNDCSSPPRSAIAWKRTVHARSVMLLSSSESQHAVLRERSRRRRFSKPPISKHVDSKEISSPSNSQSINKTDPSPYSTSEAPPHHCYTPETRPPPGCIPRNRRVNRLQITSPSLRYRSSLLPAHPHIEECPSLRAKTTPGASATPIGAEWHTAGL